MPEDWRSVFDVCTYMYLSNPEFQEAQKRKTAHFLTELEFPDKNGDREETEEFRDFLENDLKIMDVLALAGEEDGVYGNSLLRMHLPFNRFLVDTRRGAENRAEWSLQSFPENEVRYLSDELKYEVPDPTTSHLDAKKRKRAKFFFCDRRDMTMKRMRLHTIDPRQCYIKHNQWSGSNSYVVTLDESFVSQIKAGILWQINETPLWVLEAVNKGHCIQFSDGEVFHLKSPTISGISNGGWGIPGVLRNYRNLHQRAVYRKIDEAVGRDYILPMRIFSPQNSGSITDAINIANLGEWRASAAQMIKNHRADPFAMHAFPFPMLYTQAGGDGMSLVPKDIQKYQVDTMLDGAGFPSELFHGTMQFQATPLAMRNFEQSHRSLGRGMSDAVAWIAEKATRYMGRARIVTRLARPTVVDDLERRSIFLQLAASGEFPRSLAYRGFNAGDPVENARIRAMEDKDIAAVTEKVQLDYEREKALGSLSDFTNQALGQAPGGVQYSPMDKDQEIQEEAMRLLSIPEDGVRSKELRAMQATDRDKHALVKQRMEEIRSQGASQGRAQAAQMAQQG